MGDNTETIIITPEMAADSWVTNNPDPEVRRMYGHYHRAFMAGQKWQKEQESKVVNNHDLLVEALKKIIEMNLQTAEDKYGDRTKAESWSCVVIAREALSKAE